MRRLFLGFAYFAAVLSAQQLNDLFDKAPPEIDDALRARITKFYQYFSEGKFRAADALVAEDSKDVYFESDHDKCFSFEIVKITYTDNYTKATAVTKCEVNFSTGFQIMRAPRPFTTFWKVVDGIWFWYALPRNGEMDSPWGKMHAGPGGGTSTAVGPPKIPTAEEILNQITVSKTQVKLSSVQVSSDEVVIANKMPGSIHVSVAAPPTAGLVVKLDHADVAGNSEAHLSFKYDPPDKSAKSSVDVQLRVEPTQQVFPIKIVFTLSPELQKQLDQMLKK